MMLGLLEARNVLAASLLRLPERPSHEAGLVCLASALETLVRRKVPANCPHTDSMLLSKGLELLPYGLLRLPKQGSLGVLGTGAPHSCEGVFCAWFSSCSDTELRAVCSREKPEKYSRILEEAQTHRGGKPRWIT